VSATSPGAAFDLLAAYVPPDGAFFDRRGVGVATAGVQERVPPDEAVERLRDRFDPSGDRAGVAVGALGFADAAGGMLTIAPRTVRRRQAGASPSVVEVGGGHAAPFQRVLGGAPSAAFEALQLREVPAAKDYAEAVATATARIRAGGLRKVVLARTIEVEAGRMLDPRRLAQRVRAVSPDAYTFAVPAGDGVLVGASPELLVARHGREVTANPLAGSAPRAGDPDEDLANAEALSASAKDLEEHAIVVEAVAETLRPFCEELTWDREPVLMETPNVWHLSTRFRGALKDPAPSAVDLALALHPTPAVGGTPRDVALAAMAELEPFERGAYAGPVGWVDAEGDGEWAIALRCALLAGERATLSAGAGIVANSDPWAEVEETDRKFRAFLDALRWG
jgi:isochorismate synthase